MSELVTLHYDVDGNDFAAAGEASMKIKKELRNLGFPQDVIRRIAIAVYEGEINMVIHADGGTADVSITRSGRCCQGKEPFFRSLCKTDR